VLDRLKKNVVIKKILKTNFGKKLKNTFIVRKIRQPVKDWRYPLFRFSWWISRVIVPRRKISIDNINFTLTCTNWITHFRWYLFKIKEPEVRYFIDKYVNDGNIFFDIGANVGVFSIYAAKKYKNIKVHSFEPEVSNLSVLKENIVKNKIMDKVDIYGVALSNFTGLSKLFLQDLTTGSACHTESTEKIERSTEGGYPIIWHEGIFAITLDYFCKNSGIVPNAIKIDTDGNEDKILEGAQNILKDKKLKSIIIEISANEDLKNYCRAILLKSGFHSIDYIMEKTKNEIWIKS